MIGRATPLERDPIGQSLRLTSRSERARYGGIAEKRPGICWRPNPWAKHMLMGDGPEPAQDGPRKRKPTDGFFQIYRCGGAGGNHLLQSDRATRSEGPAWTRKIVSPALWVRPRASSASSAPNHGIGGAQDGGAYCRRGKVLPGAIRGPIRRCAFFYPTEVGSGLRLIPKKLHQRISATPLTGRTPTIGKEYKTRPAPPPPKWYMGSARDDHGPWNIFFEKPERLSCSLEEFLTDIIRPQFSASRKKGSAWGTAARWAMWAHPGCGPNPAIVSVGRPTFQRRFTSSVHSPRGWRAMRVSLGPH